MLSAVAWARAGTLAETPALYHPTAADIALVWREKMAQGVAEEEPEDAAPAAEPGPDGEAGEAPDAEEQREALAMFAPADEANVEDEQIGDFLLGPGDNMLMCARAGDMGYVDCLVYNGRTDELFLHHSFATADLPLSVTFLDFLPGGSGEEGAFAAVSTFSNEIEIWDLNLLDALHPTCVLGGTLPVRQKHIRLPNGRRVAVGTAGAPSGSGARRVAKPGAHSGPIISLAWSPLHRNILASCSEDGTVKAWDLNQKACVATFSALHSGGPVNCVEFHPSLPGIVATSGLGDKRIVLASLQSSPKTRGICVSSQAEGPSGDQGADVEALQWMGQEHLAVVREDGSLEVLGVAAALRQLESSPEKPGACRDIASCRITIQQMVLAIANGGPSPAIPEGAGLSAVACHPFFAGLIAIGSVELPFVFLVRYDPAANALVPVCARQMPTPVYSLSWCGGEDSYALAVGGKESCAYVLQPLRWLPEGWLAAAYGSDFRAPELKAHALLVDRDSSMTGPGTEGGPVCPGMGQEAGESDSDGSDESAENDEGGSGAGPSGHAESGSAGAPEAPGAPGAPGASANRKRDRSRGHGAGKRTRKV